VIDTPTGMFRTNFTDLLVWYSCICEMLTACM